jgi:hypothetical protein
MSKSMNIGAPMTTQPMIETPHSEKQVANLPAQDAVEVPETANDNAAPQAAAAVAPAVDKAITAEAVATPDAAPEAAMDTAPAAEEALRKQVPPVEATLENTPALEVSTMAQNQSVHSDALVMSPAERDAMNEAKSHPENISKLVIHPGVFKSAEQNLAHYIGSKISPELTRELKLDLKVRSGDDRTGHAKSDLVLYLQGDLVDANSALIESQVLDALKELPNIAPFFNTEHKPRATNNADYPNTLHIIIPNLAIAQYAHLVQSLAGGIEASNATPAHTPAHTHPAAEVAAKAQANAAAVMAGHPPANAVADVNHLGVANNNEIAPTSMAAGR